MNTFVKCPIEIRLQILESFDDYRQVLKASQGCSAISSLVQEYKTSLLQHFLQRDLDDGLMQDALAIIYFPQFPPGTHITLRQHNSVVDAHLKRWARKGLANPLQESPICQHVLCRLEELCFWMWRYIEDYLSKATSEYLPWAYRRLPSWSTTPARRDGRLLPEAQPFDRSWLNPEERRRIFRAFLRYELLCRVYGPMGTELSWVQGHDSRPTGYWGVCPLMDSERGYVGSAGDIFRHWDWTLLNRLEGTMAEKVDLEMLPCVREYVLTLYGAYIAHGAALPPRSPICPTLEHAPGRGQGRFPETFGFFFFFADEIPPWTGWSDEVVSLLASAGFDMLNHMFTMGVYDFKMLYESMGRVSPRIDAVSLHVSLSSPSLNRSWYPNSFVRLQRQRAWPLFSDPARRPGPELPSVETYVSSLGDPSLASLFRHGLNSPGVRNERIAHGAGIWTDPFFLGLGKVSFWKVGENVHRLPGKRNSRWLGSKDGVPTVFEEGMGGWFGEGVSCVILWFWSWKRSLVTLWE